METYAIERVIEDSRVFLNVMTDDAIDELASLKADWLADKDNKKITLKHGEIKNLEMPPMTMAFRVADASVVGDLKPGDKVRFRAEQVSGAYHVRWIEKAP